MGRSITGQIVYGNALQSNGTSSYAIRGTDTTTVTNNFTLSFWAKITALTAGNSCFFEVGQTDANGYRVYVTSAGLLKTQYSTVITFSSGMTLSLATWYHIVVVRDTGVTQHYVNGSAVGGTTSTAPFSPNGWAIIGASKASTGVVSEYANSAVDDVRFYERALNSGEITALYNQQSDPSVFVSSANLKLWYKINETSGTTLTDSASGFTMTLTNSPTLVQGIVVISNIPARTVAGARTTAGTRIKATQ